MKQGYTDIGIVLDRSGSMTSVRADTIGGFNAFLKAQKEAPGEATITLVQFDNVIETVYLAKPLENAPELTPDTFVPRGMTALLDAIGSTITSMGTRLAAMDDADRPEKVIVVILTDGGENSSREFTKAQIDAMISHQRDTYQWEFVFLGANQDAIATAKGLGIAAGNSMTYAANAVGTQCAFDSLSNSVSNYRSLRGSAAFSDADYKAQAEAGATL